MGILADIGLFILAPVLFHFGLDQVNFAPKIGDIVFDRGNFRFSFLPLLKDLLQHDFH